MTVFFSAGSILPPLDGTLSVTSLVSCCVGMVMFCFLPNRAVGPWRTSSVEAEHSPHLIFALCTVYCVLCASHCLLRTEAHSQSTGCRVPTLSLPHQSQRCRQSCAHLSMESRSLLLFFFFFFFFFFHSSSPSFIIMLMIMIFMIIMIIMIII